MRRLIRNLHLWIGLCLIIVLMPLGLTGSWMVFEDDFDRMLHSHRYHASAGDTELAPSRYFAAAQQAFGPRAPVAQLRMPEEEGAPAIVTGAGGVTAWLDPGSGKVLDKGEPRKELRAFAHQFHENLFMGRSGRRIVGWFGVGMFLMSVTGLITWWPRRGVFNGLRWRRSPMAWSNIHHLVGFWSSIFLAILSLTGVALAYPELLQPTRAPARGPGFEGGPRRFFFAPPVASPHLTADQAVSSAEKAAGAMDFLSVSVPTQGGPPSWMVAVVGPNGRTMISVDDKTGQASAFEGRGGRPGFGGGERRFGRPPAMRTVRWLHAGDDAPMAWRVLLFVVGLVPTILGLTGLVIWLRTLRRPELHAPDVG